MPATNQGNLADVRYELCWVFVDEYECGWTSGGIAISGSSDSSGIEVDQETDPIITVTTSTTTEITVPLAQWNRHNLELAFPGSEWRGTSPNEYLVVGSGGSTPTHTLRLHPKDMSDDDFSKDIFFPNVTVSTNLDIAINKGELQLLNLTFTVGPGNPPVTEKAGDKMYVGNVPAGARHAVTAIEVTPATLTLTVNQQQQLTWKITPENATIKGVTWTSSDDDVATVSALGVVFALTAGTATITATTLDGGETDTCAVTVS
jgi:uncharacterized protein YjdB